MEANKQINAITIIADVIDSRKNRKEIELQEVAHLLNQTYQQDCITPFTIRSGDELFAVLSNYSDAYLVLKDLLILSNQKKLPLYVGIGLGTVNAEETVDANKINGSAIWHAADALELLKEGGSTVKHFTNKSATFRYLFFTKDDIIPNMLINYMTAFIFEEIESRTDKQAEIISVYEAHPDQTLAVIGEKLGYKKNPGLNVSKTLTRSNYHFINAAEQELIHLLKQIQS